MGLWRPSCNGVCVLVSWGEWPFCRASALLLILPLLPHRCGGGNLLIAMARQYPKSTFHGYEVSTEAIEHAGKAIASSGLRNVCIHDARTQPLSESGPFDVVTTFDVLHGALVVVSGIASLIAVPLQMLPFLWT